MRGTLLLLLLLASARGAEPPVVLLTAFGPFDGRGVNGSATVATALDGTRIAGAEVHIAVMPVRWGEPGRIIPVEVGRLHPVLVLGLGEGRPGLVTVERRGLNQRLAYPDVDGHRPPAATIEAGIDAPRPGRLQFSPAWFPDAPVPLRGSDDAGGYLCNEALWVILGTRVPRAGFVHLPPQGAEVDAAYRARFVPVVQELLRRNLPP